MTDPAFPNPPATMETRWQHCPRGPLGWAHVPLQAGVGARLIVGGGGTPPLVHDLFFHLAGGAAARVLHIPSATGLFDEIDDKRAYYGEFYDRHPASFEFLHTSDRAVARTRAFAAPLGRATGVWIGGGCQRRLPAAAGGAVRGHRRRRRPAPPAGARRRRRRHLVGDRDRVRRHDLRRLRGDRVRPGVRAVPRGRRRPALLRPAAAEAGGA